MEFVAVKDLKANFKILTKIAHFVTYVPKLSMLVIVHFMDTAR